MFELEDSVGSALKLNNSSFLHNGLFEGFPAPRLVSLPAGMCVTVVVDVEVDLGGVFPDF